jgi:UDP-glucose 4-epimerase
MGMDIDLTATHVLITGGAGYIGSHAALACLAAGYRVTIVDNLSTGVRSHVAEDATFVGADIADLQTMRQIIVDTQVDAIMHFAGSIVVPESVADPGLYYENNTGKSLGLARLAAELGIKAFIFSSTAAVYAPGAIGPLNEGATKGPLSPYGHSKLMTEQMLTDISAAHGLCVGVLRYFNVAGADPLGRSGQSSRNATHLIKVACEVAVGKRDLLPVFGTDYDTRDGSCIRDYIHVSDLADAHVLLLTHLLAGGTNITANCGYGQGASVFDVIKTLEAQINRQLPLDVRERRAGDAPTLIADSSLLRATLPWQPRFADLDQIVAAALAWERHLGANSIAH